MTPLTEARLKAWLVVTAIACALLVAWALIERSARLAPVAAGEDAIAVDRSAPAMSEREAAVEKMIADGLIRRIEKTRDGSPRVVLRPAFYVLDAETRTRHIEAVYALYFDGSRITDTVYLRDARHGNEVGEYNPYAGGLRMVR